jgi:hypothetical protein
MTVGLSLGISFAERLRPPDELRANRNAVSKSLEATCGLGWKSPTTSMQVSEFFTPLSSFDNEKKQVIDS